MAWFEVDLSNELSGGLLFGIPSMPNVNKSKKILEIFILNQKETWQKVELSSILCGLLLNAVFSRLWIELLNNLNRICKKIVYLSQLADMLCYVYIGNKRIKQMKFNKLLTDTCARMIVGSYV